MRPGQARLQGQRAPEVRLARTPAQPADQVQPRGLPGIGTQLPLVTLYVLIFRARERTSCPLIVLSDLAR